MTPRLARSRDTRQPPWPAATRPSRARTNGLDKAVSIGVALGAIALIALLLASPGLPQAAGAPFAELPPEPTPLAVLGVAIIACAVGRRAPARLQAAVLRRLRSIVARALAPRRPAPLSRSKEGNHAIA